MTTTVSIQLSRNKILTQEFAGDESQRILEIFQKDKFVIRQQTGKEWRLINPSTVWQVAAISVKE